jgi:rod shape-determining protein MreC
LKRAGIVILVLALLLTVVSLTLSALLPGRTSFLSNAAGIVTLPLRRGVASAVEWAARFYGRSYEAEVLLEENRQLKLRIAELEEQAREGEEDSRENARLRKLLELREKRRDFAFESASVLSRDATNWASTLTISKGTSSGVAAGDCVVTETGCLVGVVSEAGYNWAAVETLIDAGIEMGALVFRTGEAAIVEGDFSLMREGKLKLTYLPVRGGYQVGDLVLTSGKGGAFPSGLLVGRIESVGKDPSGMSDYGVVNPSVELDLLTEVFVIKDFDIIE